MRTMAKASVRRSPKARGGFTLIEAALATVIVGVGIVAMVDAQQAFIRSNMWSSHAATGTFLANEIRELTRHLPKHDPVTGLYLEADGNGNSTLRGWGRESGEVSVLDFDDLDDFDGVSFSFFGPSGLDDGQYAGPINAFGEVIPNISIDGEVAIRDEQTGVVEPMIGWTQNVLVQKVDPFNTSVVVANGAWEPALGNFAGRAVHEYPLRVTVEVTYQGPMAINPEVVARVTWIVP